MSNLISGAAVFQGNSKKVTNQFLDAALAYAANGYRVFPCAAGEKTPRIPGGHNSASDDPATLRQWWARWPDANIGLEASGLVVIDVDGIGNNWPEDPEKHADMMSVPKQVTPRGGFHIFYAKPAGKSYRLTASKLAPNVDTRTDGGYVVVWPSVVKGTQYEWVRHEDSLITRRREDLPYPHEWLVEKLDGLVEAKGRPSASIVPAKPRGVIPEGQRNIELTRRAGGMRAKGMDYAAMLAELVDLNQRECCPPLEEKELRQIADSMAKRPAGIAHAPIVSKPAKPTESDPVPLDYDLVVEDATGPGERIRWLIRGFAPLGKLVLLSGPGGLAKSTFCRHVSACLASGRGEMASEDGKICSSLWLRYEDGVNDQIKPNLQAEGLSEEECKRVKLVNCVAQNDGRELLADSATPTIIALRKYLQANPDIKLIFVDPLIELFPEGADPNSGVDARRMLLPFRDIARDFDLCVVMIAHDSKNQEQRGANKIAHSTQIPNGCRLVFKLEADGDCRKVVLVKGNIPKRDLKIFKAILEYLPVEEAREIAIKHGADVTGWSDADFDVYHRTIVTVEQDTGVPPKARRKPKDQECAEFIRDLLLHHERGEAPSTWVKEQCEGKTYSGGTFYTGKNIAIANKWILVSGSNKNQTVSINPAFYLSNNTAP